MYYAIQIPAHLMARAAAGSVVPMLTAAGTTTTLVSASTGAIVGTATLTPVVATSAGVAGVATAESAAAGAAAATTGLALGPILLGAGVAVAVVALGYFLWKRHSAKSHSVDDLLVQVSFDTREEADAALAEVIRLFPEHEDQATVLAM